jgi:hypothetical protein
MAAPAGDLGERSMTPRALLVVDRTLRERNPGIYETTATVRHGGLHQVVLFVDNPRLIHCFPLTVQARAAGDSGGQAQRAAAGALPGEEPVAASAIVASLETVAGQRLAAGRTEVVHVRLARRDGGKAVAGVADLKLLVQSASGNWSQRGAARPLADGGYAATVAVPAPGLYYVYFECPSLGLTMRDSPRSVIAAAGPDEGSR